MTSLQCTSATQKHWSFRCVCVCTVWRCVVCGVWCVFCGGLCKWICTFSFHFTTTHIYVLVLSGLQLCLISLQFGELPCVLSECETTFTCIRTFLIVTIARDIEMAHLVGVDRDVAFVWCTQHSQVLPPSHQSSWCICAVVSLLWCLKYIRSEQKQQLLLVLYLGTV